MSAGQLSAFTWFWLVHNALRIKGYRLTEVGDGAVLTGSTVVG